MDIMAIFGYVVTAGLALVIGLAISEWRYRARVFYTVGQHAHFELSDSQSVESHSITIRNIGWKTADRVEVIHPARPWRLAIDPPIACKEREEPTGEFVLSFETLAPKSNVTIAYLQSHTRAYPTAISSVRGPAKFRVMEEREKPPTWLKRLNPVMMMMAGAMGMWMMQMFMG